MVPVVTWCIVIYEMPSSVFGSTGGLSPSKWQICELYGLGAHNLMYMVIWYALAKGFHNDSDVSVTVQPSSSVNQVAVQSLNHVKPFG